MEVLKKTSPDGATTQAEDAAWDEKQARLKNRGDRPKHPPETKGQAARLREQNEASLNPVGVKKFGLDPGAKATDMTAPPPGMNALKPEKLAAPPGSAADGAKKAFAARAGGAAGGSAQPPPEAPKAPVAVPNRKSEKGCKMSKKAQAWAANRKANGGKIKQMKKDELDKALPQPSTFEPPSTPGGDMELATGSSNQMTSNMAHPRAVSGIATGSGKHSRAVPVVRPTGAKAPNRGQ
jgi:hypothetical protein